MTDDNNAPAQPGHGAAPLDKSYDPHAIERRIYPAWERQGYFKPAGSGPAYCIAIPPPNVTGSLHMGHAFQDTLMDALIRYHRMKGDNTLWQAGTDHAGIATQMVVERQLEHEGKTRHDLGREAFVARVWQWKRESGDTITKQLRRMGASLDWSRERFTMDEGLSRAVTEVFVRLYEEGLIYRGKRLVNWDPVLHTAISDLEVEAEEEPGYLWHIRYPLTGGGHLVVATTRPETMLGDAAVAVHPDDERYKKFIGKQVELPLTGRKIPVIADQYVDKEFGSGCLKITPAHDFNDYEVGKRHNLPLFVIFTRDAAIISDTDWPAAREGLRHAKLSHRHNVVDVASDIGIPKKYWGLDRYEARKRIVADLEAQGLLERVQEHKLMVPRGDRSGAIVEPYLTDQWFVNVAPLARASIAAVEQGRIKFVPENWTATYFQWMHNIQDWCISRQLWWGHRIPAWYDAEGNIYVARDAAAARAQATAKHGAGVPLEQDQDVLDTWFSSALWPYSTLGWPDQTAELKTFYPTSVLVTGFDIIFFWVARMIMLGLKFMGDVPFREIYIHGLVRDAHGEKMSKSKGNILDPLDLIDGIDLETLVRKRTTGLMRPQDAPKIEKATRQDFPHGIPAYGTDALRFTFANLATQGRDIKFDLGRIEGYRNFCNKLWNAARYVLMNTEGHDCGQSGEALVLNQFDRWIVGRLSVMVIEVERSLREYRFDLAAQSTYNFVWHEYCDWYLELSKVVLQNAHAAADAKRGTRHTLVNVLETLLRALHPLMPFITEEIWRRVAPLAGTTGGTVMRQPFPKPTASVAPEIVDEVEWVRAIITAVRSIRSERDISPTKPLPVWLAEGSEKEKEWWARNHARYIKPLARAEDITWVAAGHAAPESAMALVGMTKVLVPLGSLIDQKAELARLDKEITKTEKEIERAKGKLANADFVARAPKQVVQQEQRRLEDFESALAKLRSQRVKVAALGG